MPFLCAILQLVSAPFTIGPTYIADDIVGTSIDALTKKPSSSYRSAGVWPAFLRGGGKVPNHQKLFGQ